MAYAYARLAHSNQPAHPTQPTTADNALATSTGAASAAAGGAPSFTYSVGAAAASKAAAAGAGTGGAAAGAGATPSSKRTRDPTLHLPTRPVLFTSAPRGPVPYDVPLIVTPLVPLPDHALAAVHVQDLAALRRTGDPDAGRERVCDRVSAMRAAALSEPLLEWCVRGFVWVGEGATVDWSDHVASIYHLLTRNPPEPHRPQGEGEGGALGAEGGGGEARDARPPAEAADGRGTETVDVMESSGCI